MEHEQLLLFSAIMTFTLLVVGLVFTVLEYRDQIKNDEVTYEDKNDNKKSQS